VIPAPPIIGQGFVGGILRFDSTHFPHNTYLNIKFEATYHKLNEPWDQRTVTSRTVNTTTYNHFYGYGHPSLAYIGYGPGVWAAQSAAINHLKQVDQTQKVDTTLLEDMMPATFSHVDTHGRLDTQATGLGDAWLSGVHDRGFDSDLVDNGEILDSKIVRSQLSPIPPMNLVVQLHCPLFNPLDDLDSPLFWKSYAEAWLYPTDAGVRDRAMVMWRGAVEADPGEQPVYIGTNYFVSRDFSQVFYLRMQQGYQVSRARDLAMRVLIDYLEGAGIDVPSDEEAAAQRELLRQIMPVFGDQRMTLHYVYLDLPSIYNSTEWYQWQ